MKVLEKDIFEYHKGQQCPYGNIKVCEEGTCCTCQIKSLYDFCSGCPDFSSECYKNPCGKINAWSEL